MCMDKIAKSLLAGQAVVLPTETVYGLFAQALNEKAVDAVYELKKRPRDKALNLNVASKEQIYAYSKEQPAYLDQVIEAFLPGPLTIILKANDQVPSWVNSDLDTVGFRMPAHDKTLEYIASFGPLIGPSANVSGLPSGRVYKDILEQFEAPIEGLEDDAFLTGSDSTILDLSGAQAVILRQGALTKEQIKSKVPTISFKD